MFKFWSQKNCVMYLFAESVLISVTSWNILSSLLKMLKKFCFWFVSNQSKIKDRVPSFHENYKLWVFSASGCWPPQLQCREKWEASDYKNEFQTAINLQNQNELDIFGCFILCKSYESWARLKHKKFSKGHNFTSRFHCHFTCFLQSPSEHL